MSKRSRTYIVPGVYRSADEEEHNLFVHEMDFVGLALRYSVVESAKSTRIKWRCTPSNLIALNEINMK